MRRSHAPSSKKIGDSAGGGDDAGENGGQRPLMTIGESIVACRNAAAVKSGRCIVTREPIMNFLMVQQGRPTKTKFISPSSNRTSDSDKLFKKKVLGLRKPQAHQFIKSTGVPRGAGFAPVLQEVTNFSFEPAEEEGAIESVPDLCIAPEEKTWEPLVLWRGEVEKEDGETFTHTIEVSDALCKVLRPHQREGVQFVFECVTGQGDCEGNGCILGDEMGLGKTLQSIVVLHTLLKKGFKPGERIAKKAIVVTPTSLVKNWANEIKKWVGDDNDLQVVAVTDSGKSVKVEITKFLSGPRNRVLIISYETFRGHIKSFPPGCKGCCDLLICDEAHRLKNADTITNRTLATLECRRRILLTGTPLQNDLSEFYAMVDFTNPGILGTPKEFNRNMVRHILAGREPDATDSAIRKAQECQYEMSTLINEFILRRTNTLNAQHLPPKLVQVVCCRLTDIQRKIYRHLLSSKEIRHICEGKQTNILASLNALQKLCNHPHLLQEINPSAGSSTRGGANPGKAKAAIGLNDISHLLPPGDVMRGGRGVQVVRAELSGKMMVLERLMQQMRAVSKDRIVVVSNYTQTLDLIGSLCQNRGWPSVRLDGSTNVAKRQKMVDVFNDPMSNSFAFLLSSKAGGCGINLIGANRLVLFDPDWNPAVDKQAAARVWREGQKKRCFIYRFVTAGTVEEKIFMRQLSKEGLQSIVEDKEEVNALSSKDLRQLFKFDEDTVSDIHKKLACSRCPTEALKKSRAQDDDKGFNRAQSQAVQGLISQLKNNDLMVGMIEEIRSLAGGLNAEEKADLLNMEEVSRRLEAKEYKSIPAFAKHVRSQMTMTDKAAKTAANQKLQEDLYRFQQTFEQGWRSLAPRLLLLRGQVDEEEESNDDNEEEEVEVAAAVGGAKAGVDEEKKEVPDSEGGGGAGGSAVAAEGDGDGEGGGEGKFQPQVGMPLEEDMNNWSHHWSVETVDDPVMRTAMLGASDVVSFVFGLEVTWDLLQKYPQPEAKPKEKRSSGKGGKKRSLAGGGGGDGSDEDSVSDGDDEAEEKAPVKKGQGRPPAGGGPKKSRAGKSKAAAKAKSKASSGQKKMAEKSDASSSEEESEDEASSGSSSNFSDDDEDQGKGDGMETESEDEGPKKRGKGKQPPPSKAGKLKQVAKRDTSDEEEEEEDSDDDDDGPRRRKKSEPPSPTTAHKPKPKCQPDPELEIIELGSSDDDEEEEDQQPKKKRLSAPAAATTGHKAPPPPLNLSQTQTETEEEGDDESRGRASQQGEQMNEVVLEDPSYYEQHEGYGIEVIGDEGGGGEEDEEDHQATAPTPLSGSRRSSTPAATSEKRKRVATNRFAPNPPRERKKRSPAQSSSAEDEKKKKDGWRCGSCTYLNAKNKKKCDMCLEKKTEKEVDSDEELLNYEL